MNAPSPFPLAAGGCLRFASHKHLPCQNIKQYMIQASCLCSVRRQRFYFPSPCKLFVRIFPAISLRPRMAEPSAVPAALHDVAPAWWITFRSPEWITFVRLGGSLSDRPSGSLLDRPGGSLSDRLGGSLSVRPAFLPRRGRHQVRQGNQSQPAGSLRCTGPAAPRNAGRPPLETATACGLPQGGLKQGELGKGCSP